MHRVMFPALMADLVVLPQCHSWISLLPAWAWSSQPLLATAILASGACAAMPGQPRSLPPRQMAELQTKLQLRQPTLGNMRKLDVFFGPMSTRPTTGKSNRARPILD